MLDKQQEQPQKKQKQKTTTANTNNNNNNISPLFSLVSKIPKTSYHFLGPLKAPPFNIGLFWKKWPFVGNALTI